MKIKLLVSALTLVLVGCSKSGRSTEIQPSSAVQVQTAGIAEYSNVTDYTVCNRGRPGMNRVIGSWMMNLQNGSERMRVRMDITNNRLTYTATCRSFNGSSFATGSTRARIFGNRIQTSQAINAGAYTLDGATSSSCPFQTPVLDAAYSFRGSCLVLTGLQGQEAVYIPATDQGFDGRDRDHGRR